MKYFQIVAAIAFACFVSANAQGDEVFIRNVCDTLASKGHDPVTLVATDLIETKWVASKKSGNWTHGTATKNALGTYDALQPIVKSASFRFPLSIVAGCRASSNVPFKYMSWAERKWKKDSLDYNTYIFDSYALSMGDYDSTNTNNFLILVSDPPVEREQYESDEIMISKSFEFAFEWWFAAAELKWQKAGGGYSMKYYNSAAHDSISAFRTMFESMKAAMGNSSSGIPDTLSTANLQVIKVVLKDSEKTMTIIEPATSSSVVPPSSSSDKPQSSATQSSSSSDTPKSSAVNSSSSDVPKSSSSGDTPKSSAVQSSSSSKDTPASSSSVTSSSSTTSCSSGDTPKSSSSDTPECSDSKSSSSEGSEAIATVRTEFVDEEIVEVRGLDGRLVKNSGNVKPGIYYARTSQGTWLKKVILPRGH